MERSVILSLIILFLGCKQKENSEVAESREYGIAYNVLYNGENDDYEVYGMELDGSRKRNLTNLSGVEWTYHANGDQVFFISDKDTMHRHYFLYRMKYDGSSVKKISDIRLADSWHNSRKNGSELIVKPHHSVDTAFYIIDTTGQLLKRIKPDFDMFSDPAFSPDGSQIAFRAGHRSRRFERGYDDEIYLMDENGEKIRQLTHFPVTDTLKKWHSYGAGPPRWHPSGEFISYQSERDGRYNLYAVSPTDGREWKLTENTFSEGWHDWSPDGKWLAIEVFDKDQTEFDIVLMNYKTKTVTMLTDSSYTFEQAPVFYEIRD